MKFGTGSITSLIALAIVTAALSLSSVETPPQPKVAAAWFAGWHENQFAPKDVPWSKLKIYPCHLLVRVGGFLFPFSVSGEIKSHFYRVTKPDPFDA